MTTYSECKETIDRVSGVRVRQLTNHLGHSHHPYFTNPPWFDDGNKMVIASDRGNHSNLFSVDLGDASLRQVTDFQGRNTFLHTAINPRRDEAYCQHSGAVWAVDLASGRRREIWRVPAGFANSMLNVTADGAAVCIGIYEDQAGKFDLHMHSGYIGFRETFEARPLSQIYRIPVDGGSAQVIHEAQTWIGHVNTSPTQANLLTFCHEGPWHLVDHRIWGLEISTGRTWQIRQRDYPEERIGHEYWYADGLHIGYHGSYPDGRKFLGRIRYDNADRVEAGFPGQTGHIHSNDHRLIVGDGGKVIRLWQWDGQSYQGPRLLCRHWSSMHHQQSHAHPRFTPDASSVVFTSDVGGYCNVYIADVPDFEKLPAIEE